MVPTFIDSKCYRGQAIDHKVLYSDYVPLTTDTGGSFAAAIDLNPSLLLGYTWRAWADVYEEYRFTRVTAEIRAIQPTTTKGISAFWFDPNGNTSPSLSQASVRWVKTVRNANVSSGLNTISYEFKEIENLSYRFTESTQPFTDTTFCAYTESAVFDSPPSTLLYLVRFRFDTVFKNLRTTN